MSVQSEDGACWQPLLDDYGLHNCVEEYPCTPFVEVKLSFDFWTATWDEPTVYWGVWRIQCFGAVCSATMPVDTFEAPQTTFRSGETVLFADYVEVPCGRICGSTMAATFDYADNEDYDDEDDDEDPWSFSTTRRIGFTLSCSSCDGSALRW